MQCAGQKFDATSMADLKRGYSALSDAERQLYERMGAEATALHQAEAPSFPAHSQRARRGRRGRRNQDREAASQREDLMQLSRSVLRGRSDSVPVSFVTHVQCSMSGGIGDENFGKQLFDRAVWSLSKSLRSEAEALREKEKQAVEALRSQSATAAAALLHGRRRLRDLEGVKWLALPARFPTLTPAFSAQRCFGLSQLTPTAHAGPEDRQESASALSEKWKERHMGVQASACPPVTAASIKDRSSLCWKAGVCRCSGSGRWLNHFFLALKGYLNNLCADGKFLEQLTQGWIVLLWCGSKIGEANASASGSASSSNMPLADNMLIWTHIALHYKQPWRPTFVEMVMPESQSMSAGPAKQDLGTGPIRLRVKTTAGAQAKLWSVWSFLESLNQELEWTLEAWQLSSRLCPFKLDGSVVVFRVQEPSTVVWQGPTQRQRAPPEPAAHDILFDGPVAETQREQEEEEEEMSGTLQEVFLNVLQQDYDPLVEDRRDEEVGVAIAEPASPAHAEMEATRYAGDAENALENVAPLHVLEHPGNWKVFKCSLKRPQGTFRGAYEITCPFHKLSERTMCKKLVTLPSNDIQGMRTALAQARFWAIQATAFGRQRDHVHQCSYKDNVPSLATLEGMHIPDPPAVLKTDVVLDRENEAADGGQQASSSAPSVREAGRGNARGRGRGRAKAAAAKSVSGPPQVAPAQEPATAVAAVAEASSDSSDSSESSSSDSSA